MRKKDTISPAGTFAGPEEAVFFSRAIKRRARSFRKHPAIVIKIPIFLMLNMNIFYSFKILQIR